MSIENKQFTEMPEGSGSRALEANQAEIDRLRAELVGIGVKMRSAPSESQDELMNNAEQIRKQISKLEEDSDKVFDKSEKSG